MKAGGCLCGKVRYQIAGPVRDIIACHCQKCRRMSGHYFAATAAAWEDVEIIDTNCLSWFESSKTSRRGFCRTCGSSLFFDHGKESPLGISAGSLDDSNKLAIAAHIYVDEQGAYYHISAGEQQLSKIEWRNEGWGFILWHEQNEA